MRRLHLIAVAFFVLLVSMTVSIASAAPPGRVFVAIAYFTLVIFLGHQTYMNLNRLAALAK